MIDRHPEVLDAQRRALQDDEMKEGVFGHASAQRGSDLADTVGLVARHPSRIRRDALAARRCFEPVLPVSAVDGFKIAGALHARNLGIDAFGHHQCVADDLRFIKPRAGARPESLAPGLDRRALRLRKLSRHDHRSTHWHAAADQLGGDDAQALELAGMEHAARQADALERLFDIGVGRRP